MGYLEVAHLSVVLPDGRPLLDEVTFRVGDGARVALVGANGAGKTTLLRVIAGELTPTTGTVTRAGGLGVMRQFVGSVRDQTTVGELLLAHARPELRRAGELLDAAEFALVEHDDEPTQLRYAEALTGWGDAGGYDAEVLWDTVTVAALGVPFDQARHRMVRTLSGGEQKRLVLEVLLRSTDEVLLLDEPDNYLDVPGKRWLEERLAATEKTVLYVSHDRELLARTATHLVTVEGGSTWVHGGGFASYQQARSDRNDRIDELRRRWEEEHQRLRELVRSMRQYATVSDVMASRYQAARTRLAKFEEAGPPPARPVERPVTMRLRGGRTGVRALTCQGLGLTGLMRPFDLEVFYSERVAVLGSNGSGKSHFLRLLAGAPVAHTGQWKLGARVVAGLFAQAHEHPEFDGRTLADILWRGDAGRPSLDRGRALPALRRYGLQEQADQVFDTLSGGQQARVQILLLELSGATMLLLDEPTDNLDLLSAEALQEGLGAFEGTVLAVTHDRWFARSFDRFLVFGADGTVCEDTEPVWDLDPSATEQRSIAEPEARGADRRGRAVHQALRGR